MNELEYELNLTVEKTRKKNFLRTLRDKTFRSLEIVTATALSTVYRGYLSLSRQLLCHPDVMRTELRFSSGV